MVISGKDVFVCGYNQSMGYRHDWGGSWDVPWRAAHHLSNEGGLGFWIYDLWFVIHGLGSGRALAGGSSSPN